MLFCTKVNTAAAETADAGKIQMDGGFRLPVTTADAGKIRLGGGFRLPNHQRLNGFRPWMKIILS